MPKKFVPYRPVIDAKLKNKRNKEPICGTESRSSSSSRNVVPKFLRFPMPDILKKGGGAWSDMEEEEEEEEDEYFEPGFSLHSSSPDAGTPGTPDTGERQDDLDWEEEEEEDDGDDEEEDEEEYHRRLALKLKLSHLVRIAEYKRNRDLVSSYERAIDQVPEFLTHPAGGELNLNGLCMTRNATTYNHLLLFA